MTPGSTTEIRVPAELAGSRIDQVTAELSGLTRSRVQRLIEDGLLTVNGVIVRPNRKAGSGDLVAFTLETETAALVPQSLPLEILHLDDALIVVNKPASLVVHPAAGHHTGTLMNAIAFYAPHLADAGAPLRPGVVHRLDKDTSGVMVVALSDKAYYDLVEQFRERSIRRRYRALVYGSLRDDRGEIASRIGRSSADRKKMSTRTRRGKEALTTWRVIERYPSATQVEAVLGTGRTHQIRVHFASIAHPVLGDETYGRKTSLETGGKTIDFPRQMLHAEVLGFRHPESGEYVEFSAEPPEDMMAAIASLRGEHAHTRS